MSPGLLRKPLPLDDDGAIHRITPENAGWSYVGFEVLLLQPGQTASRSTGAREHCLVLISGRVAIEAGGQNFGTIGDRTTPFESSPWSVYISAGSRWTLRAEGVCEMAICSAPAEGKLPARVIGPDHVGQEQRGTGTNTRLVRNILPDTAEAESLLVVEVVTPGGHWSSYPPHKHDREDFPREVYLEETYYHRIARGNGFALQRVYTDDGSLDETMAVTDRDVVLVPRGYHPVGAPHGFDLYYLNVMAGPERAWRFTTSPDHDFLGWM